MREKELELEIVCCDCKRRFKRFSELLVYHIPEQLIKELKIAQRPHLKCPYCRGNRFNIIVLKDAYGTYSHDDAPSTEVPGQNEGRKIAAHSDKDPQTRKCGDAVVKFPYGYKYRKCDVLLILRERKKVYAMARCPAEVKEIEHLQRKIRYKKGVIDLSKDKVALKWLGACRFWLRPVDN